MKPSGYLPGVQVSFRIRATKGALTSAPSNVSTIYPSDPSVVLELAA